MLLQWILVLVLRHLCEASDANPAMPTPYFSWDTIPLAFHGANIARLYNEAEVEQLAKYQMVTLEKWYTPCAFHVHDRNQSGPECNVEEKMYTTFNAIKAQNPKVTTLLYLNSMFNFAFYNLNGIMLERERQGKPSLLRDKDGELVELCNDGNAYCNITTFDWSVPEVAELWLQALINATRRGGVDGVFADHGFEGSRMPSEHDLHPPNSPQLCNGNGALHKCYKFTPEFAKKFNAGHDLLLNHTQDVLSKLTGGPVLDGPYAALGGNVCNFRDLRNKVLAARQGHGPKIIYQCGACNPSESCMAAFLCAADKYTYMSCTQGMPRGSLHLPKFLPEYSKPLGEPLSDAVEGPTGVWTRKFRNPHGITTATYDEHHHRGQVQWADEARYV